MNKTKNVLWGLILIAIGVVWGCNAAGVLDINVFFDGWWTLFIIVPCAIGMITEKDRTGNIVGLLVGVVLLLACQDVVSFSMIWKLFLPAVIIIFGVSLIFKDFFHKDISNNINRINRENGAINNHVTAIFSGQDVRYDNVVFTGAQADAVFGGAKLDLTHAIIQEDVVINCSAIFGGIDLYVPYDMEVKVKSTSIFGGVSNKNHYQPSAEQKPVIYVNATCLFGGVEIK